MPKHARAATIMAVTGSLMAVPAVAAAQVAPAAARATPGPRSFGPATVLTVSLAAIERFASESLRFDTTRGAADVQPVDFARGEIGTAAAHPARIEPEIGSYALDSTALARGRIIARLWSAVPVPKLGLGPWWTYWWVDRRGPRGTWRSVFIPAGPKAGPRLVLREPLMLERHPTGQWRQGIARFWVVRTQGAGGDPAWIESWGTCGGCCHQALSLTY
jgi:hypothetical protein